MYSRYVCMYIYIYRWIDTDIDIDADIDIEAFMVLIRRRFWGILCYIYLGTLSSRI